MATARPDPAEELLRKVPFFRHLDRVDIARLIGALDEVRLLAGTGMVLEGDDADGLYLLEEGEVAVTIQTPEGARLVAQLKGPAHFGEMGLLLARRTASVHTVTDVRVWKLPRYRFEQLVRDRPTLGLSIATVLAETMDRRQRESIGAPIAEDAPRRMVLARSRPPATIWRRIGFLVAVGVPLALWWLEPPPALTSDGWHVVLIILGAAIGWLFEPLPDFAIALLMAALWGVTGLAPLSSTFTGFASSSWAVALGSLAIAAAMTLSGLLFRTALLLLRIFAPTHRGQVLGLLASGLLITPLVPLSVARIIAIAPLGLELGQALGYPPRSRATAAISFAGLTGYGYFSSIFLTGLASNFFLIELLPAAERARFDWLTWLAAAAPAGILMIVGSALALLLLFPPETRTKVTADLVQRQRTILGPLTHPERVTSLAVAILIAGMILQPMLGIGPEWLAIASLAVALAGSGLDRERFRSAIDWGFLILFGILTGTGSVMRRHGVDRWIADTLVSLTERINDPGIVLVVIGLFVVICRLVLPRISAQLLLSLALVPAAPSLGISPWLMGFVVLIVAHTWILPNQGLEYLITRDITRGEAFTDRHGFIIGVALTAVRLLAIAATIPFWRAIGLLGQ